MAKVTRSVLKEIVKECLVEILFEGIDSESGLSEDRSIVREAHTPSRKRASRPSSKGNTKQNRKLKEESVSKIVNTITDDPTMASIFADTAQTTLQEQRESRRPRIPADKAAEVVQESNLEDLFEGSNNWAALAFNEVDKNE